PVWEPFVWERSPIDDQLPSLIIATAVVVILLQDDPIVEATVGDVQIETTVHIANGIEPSPHGHELPLLVRLSMTAELLDLNVVVLASIGDLESFPARDRSDGVHGIAIGRISHVGNGPVLISAVVDGILPNQYVVCGRAPGHNKTLAAVLVDDDS